MQSNGQEKVPDFLPTPIQAALVFAARYTHNRPTWGAFAVVRALESCWHQLSKQTRELILDESKEATTNPEDWARLRAFAANVKAQPPSP